MIAVPCMAELVSGRAARPSDPSNERKTVPLSAASINIDDSVLVERSQSGDLEAMERLILKYQGRIFNVILKMSGNSDDAAELTQ
jgi:hypothetical protein